MSTHTHTHTHTKYLSISAATHTQTFPRFHSTESAVQRLRVLSGQQTGQRRAGWRSGKSWALNFQEQTAVIALLYCYCSIAAFWSVLPSVVLRPPRALISLFSSHPLFISLWSKRLCVYVFFPPNFPSSHVYFPIISKASISKMYLLHFLQKDVSAGRKYWIYILIPTQSIACLGFLKSFKRCYIQLFSQKYICVQLIPLTRFQGTRERISKRNGKHLKSHFKFAGSFMCCLCAWDVFLQKLKYF